MVHSFAKKYAAETMQKSLYNSLRIDITQENIAKIPNPEKKYMLYMHVPFCHTFCPYCSFHKYAYERGACKEYFSALRVEMQRTKDAGYDFETLYVGGGTTLINEPELEKTLVLAKELFNIKNVSCESDPNHIQPENLKRFQGLIDRLSVGVQSFDDETLKRVARYEKFGSSEALQEKLKKALGVLPVMSLDLIFNLPNQTKEQLLNDIKIAKSIAPEQITFYPLMKSPLTRDAIAKSLGVADSDNEREFYEIICESFSNYHQSNAWAFGRDSANLRDEYVGSHHEYVGVGSGAFSFLNGELVINAFNLLDNGRRVKSGESPVIAKCGFTKKERLKYIFLTELFDGGVNIAKYDEFNGANIKKELFAELNLLKLVGAIYEEGGRIVPTAFGRYLCLVLMRDFYAGMDKVRAIFKDDAKIKRSKILRIMSEETHADFEDALISPRAAV